MAANSGYIIVKSEGKDKKMTYKDFYGPLDKGSARPSFCYPKHKEALQDEVKSMEYALASGYVTPDKKLTLEIDMKKRKERLDKIGEQEMNAKRLFKEHKDKWMERRTALAEEIAARTPTRSEKAKRVVNPHRILQEEKQKGLQEKKTEYIVLSRLAEEESNIGFLTRD